jgi:hypothetical protein
MRTKNIIGVVAAVATLSLSSAAIADHEASCVDDLANMVKQSAAALACNDGATFETLGYSGTWPAANPLWQRQAGKLKRKGASEEELDAAGCAVHASLAGGLYTVRSDDGSPPRGKKNKKPTGGVVDALNPLDPNFEEAIVELLAFKASVDSSDPNPDSTNFPALPDNSNDTPSQTDWEAYLKLWADDVIYQVRACGHLEL